jgi:hypothetical protein
VSEAIFIPSGGDVLRDHAVMHERQFRVDLRCIGRAYLAFIGLRDRTRRDKEDERERNADASKSGKSAQPRDHGDAFASDCKLQPLPSRPSRGSLDIGE